MKILPKPIRVVFWCYAGQEASLAGKRRFEGLLKRHGLEELFQVDYEGIRQRSPTEIQKILSGAAYVIPMYQPIAPELEKHMKELVRPPVMINPGFNHIEDQYDQHKFEQILAQIKHRLPTFRRKPLLAKPQPFTRKVRQLFGKIRRKKPNGPKK